MSCRARGSNESYEDYRKLLKLEQLVEKAKALGKYFFKTGDAGYRRNGKPLPYVKKIVS